MKNRNEAHVEGRNMCSRLASVVSLGIKKQEVSWRDEGKGMTDKNS